MSVSFQKALGSFLLLHFEYVFHDFLRLAPVLLLYQDWEVKEWIYHFFPLVWGYNSAITNSAVQNQIRYFHDVKDNLSHHLHPVTYMKGTRVLTWSRGL
jgi:hypothetical protein